MIKPIYEDILIILADGHIHTQQEMAEKLKVSQTQMGRYIRNMKKIFPITTYRGGDTRGGTYLNLSYFNTQNLLTQNDRKIIELGLLLYAYHNLNSKSLQDISKILNKLNSKVI